MGFMGWSSGEERLMVSRHITRYVDGNGRVGTREIGLDWIGLARVE